MVLLVVIMSGQRSYVVTGQKVNNKREKVNRNTKTNMLRTYKLAIPLWVGAMSTGQRAVMLCDWGVKADMVLFAGNTV